MDDYLSYAKKAAKVLLEPLSELDRVEILFAGRALTPEQVGQILIALGYRMEEE